MGGLTRTPRYVLMLNRSPVGPSTELLNTEPLSTKPLITKPLKAGPSETGSGVRVVFGFSGKLQYDAFSRQTSQALTPYPLVKGFLQRQADLDARVLQLVVLDATGPKSLNLEAATSQAVVEAFDLKRDTIQASHELILDEASGMYRVHALLDSSNPTGSARSQSSESSPKEAQLRNVS